MYGMYVVRMSSVARAKSKSPLGMTNRDARFTARLCNSLHPDTVRLWLIHTAMRDHCAILSARFVNGM
jgi:hypothetical protein